MSGGSRVPTPSSAEPGTPQRAQERGASVKGDSDSDVDPPTQLSADEVLHLQSFCVSLHESASEGGSSSSSHSYPILIIEEYQYKMTHL